AETWRCGLRLVVEEAPAVLADEDHAGLAHLVEALGRERYPAPGADPVAADQGHRETSPTLEQPRVLREEIPRHLAGDALALAPRPLEVHLERAQLLGG